MTMSLAQAMTFLDSLGTTLRDRLAEDHATGVPESTNSALATWIKSATGAVRCDVDNFETSILFASGRTEIVYTPPNLVDFEQRFDAGEFPELVAA